jgi:DNA-binding transcriptional LysR family regulator
MLRTTLRRLEVFVAAVEAGGFRACSDQLEISQAAVSHHVRQLEDELGYPLFVRRRGATAGVTEQGVTAYRQAKDLLEDAHRLEILTDNPPGPRRRLSVHSDPVIDFVLAKRITEYMAGAPRLDVSLRQSFFEEMVESFNSGHADVVYFFANGPVAELESSLCWHEPVSICAREDHPLHADGPAELEAVFRHPFVAPPKCSHFRRCVDRMFRRMGVHDYPIAFEANHMNLAREAVINGLAISAVFTRYLDDDLSRHGVREVSLQGTALSLQVRRATRREFAADQAVAHLAEQLDGRSAFVAPPRTPQFECLRAAS